MKKYSRGHIGERFTTKEGYDGIVIDGGSKGNYVTIKINDWISEVTDYSIKNGSIKYPYHPSVLGKGYFGIGNYVSSVDGTKTSEYKIWRGILQRCYDPKWHQKHPSYSKTKVCHKWHDFQVFAHWFNKNSIDGFHLDKDLLSGVDKIYSPETCVFLPRKVNIFLTNAKNRKGDSLPTGVCKKDSGYEVGMSVGGRTIYLGYYRTIKMASQVYTDARLIEVSKIRNYMRSLGYYSEYIISKIK